jgi:hypothetical protein
MNFRSNEFSVKRPFTQFFSVKWHFLSTVDSVKWPFSENKSVIWPFGKINFRSNGDRSNGDRLNGDSVKWCFGQTAFDQTVFGQTVFGQTVFGQMVFRSNGVRSKKFDKTTFLFTFQVWFILPKNHFTESSWPRPFRRNTIWSNDIWLKSNFTKKSLFYRKVILPKKVFFTERS